jgi:hypothetical protein
MFCNQCGSEVTRGMSACPKCGAVVPVTTAVPIAGSRSVAVPGRVERHIGILAVLWMVYSALHIIAGLAMITVSRLVLAHIAAAGGEAPPAFVRPLISFIGIAILVKGVLGFAAGVGLMQRATWARMLAVVIGVISLINVPFGTALGIYTLWVLMGSGSDREYEGLAAAV